jgi:hypothetical protein
MAERQSRLANETEIRQGLRERFDQLIEQIQVTNPEELERCFTILLDVTGRAKKHEKCKSWMLARAEKAPYLTAVRLASEARYYFRMPTSLMPWLTYLARNVKARIRMRTMRVRLKADIAMAAEEEREARGQHQEQAGDA